MTEQIFFTLDNVTVPCNLNSILNFNFDRSFETFYNKNSSSLLNILCDKYGSDKGEVVETGHPYPWTSHSYADFYERLFSHSRKYFTNVFECGLGTNNPAVQSNMTVNGKPGASLRVWRDYFPNANIYGADIDRNVLFSEERVTTYYCDQTNPNDIQNMWNEIGQIDFDLIIDDGLHTYEAGIILFEQSFQRVRNEGLYIIEDVTPQSLLLFKQYFQDKNLNYEFVNLHRKVVGLGDNSLILIRKT